MTGATGFVGDALVHGLAKLERHTLVAAVRRPCSIPKCEQVHVVGDFGRAVSWADALAGVSTVIHAAARAHVMRDGAADPLVEYRKINVAGTLSLAEQAISAGVRRFVFISSIKVNGEDTPLGQRYRADNKPAPQDPYGTSKLEAEQGLMKLAAETGLEIVIIRPPLVYGPGVKGNFANMIKLVEKGVPLPLGSAQNKRSLIGIDNLVDLIIRCIDHPNAANQVFLASDGKDLSTTELLRSVGEAMGKPARLIPVPAGMLQFGATLLGKKAMAQRLLGSLQVDITKTCELLGWEPPYTVEEGLKRCFRHCN